MTLYRLLMWFKLSGVCLFAGGLLAAFLASDLTERKRAVHAIASPAVLVIWGAGYGLSVLREIPLTTPWLAAGIGLSLASQLALVYAVARDRRDAKMLAAAALPFMLALTLMIFRPSWPGTAP